MRTRILLIVAAVALGISARPASAADAPHDQTFSDGQCDNCHSLFTTSPGGKQDFTQGCLACHNQPSWYPWASGHQAAPGQGGDQHSWSGFAENESVGARYPINLEVSKRLVDGKLQCAACHNPHKSNPTYAPDERKTTFPIGAATDETGGPGGTGRLTIAAVGTTAKAFRVKIQTSNAGGGTFAISHDFGLATPSWFNWSGSAWVVGTATGPGKPYTNDAVVALDDPAVTVRVSAGAIAGDYWDFAVSYPFLRVGNVEDAFCYMCHDERVMSSSRAHGSDSSYRPNGSRRFSHPVNEALTKSYDRTAGILDANGALQSTGDGIASNDLGLEGGKVRCTTCHAVHSADSNSLTQ
jgi:hypothetical protein